ncbi:rubredoxin [Mycobacterium sp.]|uniref:rubredoxin n=1 Tax=Mycobacterium sp. TaxID=1785 RepID=UPI0039C903A2
MTGYWRTTAATSPGSTCNRAYARRCWPATEPRPDGRHRCPGCDYVYDESNGSVREGLWESPAAGTRWDELPEDWGCPDCAAGEKPDFEILEVTK